MQSYQLGEQICQVSQQCKQMHRPICRTAGYGLRLARLRASLRLFANDTY